MSKNTVKKPKKSIWSAVITVIIVAIYVLFQQVTGGTDAASGDRVEAELIRVVDGDTLIVNYKGQNTRVRLIGVNAPESVHEDESKNTEEGRDASAFLKEYLAEVNKVWLEFDVEQYDQYERMLAYVWMSSDGTDVAEDMLNGIIVDKGYAEARTYEPNVKYDRELGEIK